MSELSDEQIRIRDDFQRWFNDGGMRECHPLPGEESWASWKCGGGEHSQETALSHPAIPASTGSVAVLASIQEQASDQPAKTKQHMKTAEMTEAERHLITKGAFDYDDTAGGVDKAHKLAGFLARAAVDIARYERSIANATTNKVVPHYNKLIKALKIASNVRVQHFEDEDIDAPIQARMILGSQNWNNVMYVPVIKPSEVINGKRIATIVDFATAEQLFDRSGRPKTTSVSEGTAKDTTPIDGIDVEVVKTSGYL